MQAARLRMQKLSKVALIVSVWFVHGLGLMATYQVSCHNNLVLHHGTNRAVIMEATSQRSYLMKQLCGSRGEKQRLRYLLVAKRWPLVRADTSSVWNFTDRMIVAACVKNGKMPPPGWSTPAQNVTDVFSPTTIGLRKGFSALIFSRGFSVS
jgi:hypothetical protein